MGGYIKPWRRKLGVVTLAFACALAALWIRSRAIGDVVTLPFKYPEGDPFAPVTIDSIVSRTNSVTWRRTCHVGGARLAGDAGLSYPKWKSYSRFFERDPAKLQWRLRWLGFHIWDLQIPNRNYSESHVSVPYWSIVIPLTLLSTYLLLSKPRMKAEPTPNSNPETAT